MHWIFAYGSNMNLPDLTRWLQANGHGHTGPQQVAAARIPDYELSWNYRSQARRGGAANAVRRAGAELRGLALRADEPLLAAIDAKEGHPARYDRGNEPVHAELLACGSAVRAWLYRVTPAYESDVPVPPRAAYLRLLIDAAERHGLGDDYVARLRRMPTAG